MLPNVEMLVGKYSQASLVLSQGIRVSVSYYP